MKKSKNRVWLILGIIVIVLGVLIPFVFLNQSRYYDYTQTTHPGTETYEITITSKDKIKDIQHVSVELDLIQGGTKGYEIYSLIEEKDRNKYVYKCKLIVREDWINVKEIDSLEIKTANDTFAVSKKIGLSTKIPVAVFICVVGGFMMGAFVGRCLSQWYKEYKRRKFYKKEKLNLKLKKFEKNQA